MHIRTFHSIASFSLASSFFFSSASTLEGALASWFSLASVSGVDCSPSFVVVSAELLYHLVLAAGVTRNELKGAGENCDRTKGCCVMDLELEEMALEDLVNTCRNMMMVVTGSETYDIL
jgi:hypothetical protein